MALAVAIPSIYRDKFVAPSCNENIVHMKLSDKTSIEFNREDDSITIQLKDAEITANNDEISAVLGNAKINMREEKTEISVGDAKIEITPEKIGLYASVIEAPNLKVEL